MLTKFWLASLKERDCSEDLGVDGRIILKCILRKECLWVWIELIWLRTGTGGVQSEVFRQLFSDAPKHESSVPALLHLVTVRILAYQPLSLSAIISRDGGSWGRALCPFYGASC
jgi:hypothetical protein